MGILGYHYPNANPPPRHKALRGCWPLWSPNNPFRRPAISCSSCGIGGAYPEIPRMSWKYHLIQTSASKKVSTYFQVYILSGFNRFEKTYAHQNWCISFPSKIRTKKHDGCLKTPPRYTTHSSNILIFDLLKMLGKSKKYSPKWWFDDNLPWYKVKSQLKQNQVILTDFMLVEPQYPPDPLQSQRNPTLHWSATLPAMARQWLRMGKVQLPQCPPPANFQPSMIHTKGCRKQTLLILKQNLGTFLYIWIMYRYESCCLSHPFEKTKVHQYEFIFPIPGWHTKHIWNQHLLMREISTPVKEWYFKRYTRMILANMPTQKWYLEVQDT